MISSMLCAASLLFLSDTPVVLATSFLGDGGLGGVSALRLSRDVRRALDEVMGCGAEGAEAERVAAIELDILLTWRTLPKNVLGRVDWKTLRYVAHRYFMQQSSLIIRGFEPSLPMNSSRSGAAEILNKQVPAHVDLLLGQGHSDAGFSLEDSAVFLAALERLIFDSETEGLEIAYREQAALARRGKTAHQLQSMASHEHAASTHSKTRQELQEIIEVYVVRWLLDADEVTIREVMLDRENLANQIPHWLALQGFIDGRLRSLAFARAQAPQVGHGQSLMGAHSFDDAHEVVGSVTRSFQAFWQSECTAMKEKLITMDGEATGRVALADFYGGSEKNENWHFSESSQYLRELGALDESSNTTGPQVIIPNYIQAASNCMVTGPHYLVCCTNECESILAEVEANVSAPLATPAQILGIVAPLLEADQEMSNAPNGRPGLRHAALEEQLNRVAAAHAGQVPLHGRLFAQWLHYAFPRECPFPHMAGAFEGAHTLTTSVYGMESAVISYGARVTIMHAGRRAKALALTAKAQPRDPEEVRVQDLRMTQWSQDEELFADYERMAAPWEVPQRASHSTVFQPALVTTATAALAATAFFTSGQPKSGVRKVHRV